MAATVADVMVATLKASGVQRVYGIPGDDLPRAFQTADLRLIHAAICCSRYSS